MHKYAIFCAAVTIAPLSEDYQGELQWRQLNLPCKELLKVQSVGDGDTHLLLLRNIKGVDGIVRQTVFVTTEWAVKNQLNLLGVTRRLHELRGCGVEFLTCIDIIQRHLPPEFLAKACFDAGPHRHITPCCTELMLSREVCKKGADIIQRISDGCLDNTGFTTQLQGAEVVNKQLVQKLLSDMLLDLGESKEFAEFMTYCVLSDRFVDTLVQAGCLIKFGAVDAARGQVELLKNEFNQSRPEGWGNKWIDNAAKILSCTEPLEKLVLHCPGQYFRALATGHIDNTKSYVISGAMWRILFGEEVVLSQSQCRKKGGVMYLTLRELFLQPLLMKFGMQTEVKSGDEVLVLINGIDRADSHLTGELKEALAQLVCLLPGLVYSISTADAATACDVCMSSTANDATVYDKCAVMFQTYLSQLERPYEDASRVTPTTRVLGNITDWIYHVARDQRASKESGRELGVEDKSPALGTLD